MHIFHDHQSLTDNLLAAIAGSQTVFVDYDNDSDNDGTLEATGRVAIAELITAAASHLDGDSDHEFSVYAFNPGVDFSADPSHCYDVFQDSSATAFAFHRRRK